MARTFLCQLGTLTLIIAGLSLIIGGASGLIGTWEQKQRCYCSPSWFRLFSSVLLGPFQLLAQLLHCLRH
jgi:hypothetical protein